jgi:precorrin-6B methylase 2
LSTTRKINKNLENCKQFLKKKILQFIGRNVAKQRVTGLELLAGERMETETKINLAASFMSGGGFLSI